VHCDWPGLAASAILHICTGAPHVGLEVSEIEILSFAGTR